MRKTSSPLVAYNLPLVIINFFRWHTYLFRWHTHLFRWHAYLFDLLKRLGIARLGVKLIEAPPKPTPSHRLAGRGSLRATAAALSLGSRSNKTSVNCKKRK